MRVLSLTYFFYIRITDVDVRCQLVLLFTPCHYSLILLLPPPETIGWFPFTPSQTIRWSCFSHHFKPLVGPVSQTISNLVALLLTPFYYWLILLLAPSETIGLSCFSHHFKPLVGPALHLISNHFVALLLIPSQTIGRSCFSHHL
jgi:hypothetical protein